MSTSGLADKPLAKPFYDTYVSVHMTLICIHIVRDRDRDRDTRTNHFAHTRMSVFLTVTVTVTVTEYLFYVYTCMRTQIVLHT